MSNVLIEQYGVQKLKALRQSPYACLLDSDIQHTPHQIAAFIAALESLNNGGIILADEVGLGKTIEAGLVLKYLINKGAKRILIAMPPPLRKQWQVELKEKFGIEAVIPESKYAVEKRDKYDWERKMYKQTEPLIIITSYSTAPWLISKFPKTRMESHILYLKKILLIRLKKSTKMHLKITNLISILEDPHPVNTLACMLLDSISEFDADDAEIVLDVVNQYLTQVGGDDAEKRKIVRRYATIILEDIRNQVLDSIKTETYIVHVVQKDLIVFGKTVKVTKPDGEINLYKEIADKNNIRQYVFTGYKKSYYDKYGFDIIKNESFLKYIDIPGIKKTKWLHCMLKQ